MQYFMLLYLSSYLLYTILPVLYFQPSTQMIKNVGFNF